MTTIQTKSHVGPDGLLHLSLPVDVKDADLDVTVIVRPSTGAARKFATHEEFHPPGRGRPSSEMPHAVSFVGCAAQPHDDSE